MTAPIITVATDQNSIIVDGKYFYFKPSPVDFQAGALDCDYCVFLNTEICGHAPCDLDRKDGIKGYFKTVK